MDASGISVNIRDHGIIVDLKKSRVKCNYCGKVVSSGFRRLKCHLGGIRGDVVPCEQVPSSIRDSIRKNFLEAKKETLGREVGELFHPDLPLRRNWNPNPNTLKKPKHEVNPSRKLANDTSLSHAKRRIARFIYETGVEFSVVNSPSFRKMLEASSDRFNIPDCEELKGWILEEEVKEMRKLVSEVRGTWVSTGCSILLDGWTNEKGRNLINFVADCPRGPIFLKSCDVSASIRNVNALEVLLDYVIDDIGIANVVQIMSYTTLGCIEDLGKKLMEKHRTLFWTVSASHCIELMLEKIRMMDPIKSLLDKAKTITRFIHSHKTVLTIMRNHTYCHNLVKPSVKFVAPYLTLENMVLEMGNLNNMFGSLEWNETVWASRSEGKRVSSLVGDPVFWEEAEMVLKATIPLVRVLCLLKSSDNDKPQIGYIYETLDQAKETIKEEFKDKRAKYKPFWDVIDEFWNKYLHSPLHSAAYFLNPSLFYTTDFYPDAEVASGLLCCIVRMGGDKNIQDKISLQLDNYRSAKGLFEEGCSEERRNNITPAEWWTHYGRECPELQRFAIRILSQTCEGASRYSLKRSMSEKLLTNGRNQIEQNRLKDLTILHYNLQLRNFEPSLSIHTVVEDPMSDWVVDGIEDLSPTDSEWMDYNSGNSSFAQAVKGEGSSDFQPKQEPQ